MKIKVGSFDVLSTKSILIEIGKPVEIHFGDSDDITFIFNIINDPSKQDFSSESRLINDNKIEINLYNFIKNNAGNGGSVKPANVGTFQNRALYYSILITSGGFGLQPLFTYTFYLGEEVKNG